MRELQDQRDLLEFELEEMSQLSVSYFTNRSDDFISSQALGKGSPNFSLSCYQLCSVIRKILVILSFSKQPYVVFKELKVTVCASGSSFLIRVNRFHP